MKCKWWVGLCCWLMLAGQAGVLAAAQAGTRAIAVADTDAVVHEMCGARVALLGESPTHGFGKTLEFKAELVRRLVDECHFDALYVESGVYDYLHIERELRAGHDVPEAMISAAIGGLWANQEVQKLVPFLRERVKAGRLTLGGLDDQIGRGSYASLAMPEKLVAPLRGDERSRCLGVLERHMLWQYTDEAPYGPADKEKILGCLTRVEAQLSRGPGVTKPDEESKEMVESLKRNLARNFIEDDFSKKDQALKWFNDRDLSMYLNFSWLRGRLSPQSKIIVWAATVHTAKDLGGIAGFEGRVPMGSYLHREFMGEAFSLGFSALSGEFGFTTQPVRRLSDAPADSLEGLGLGHGDAEEVYLSRGTLKKDGLIQGRLLGTGFSAARWDEVVDGVVVFREERSPVWVGGGKR